MGEFDGLDFEPLSDRDLAGLTASRLDRIKITLGNWRDSISEEAMREKLRAEMERIGNELTIRQGMRELVIKEGQLLGVSGIDSAEGFGSVGG